MPLIKLCGYPSSGKTKRCQELQEYFQKDCKEVHIVSENDCIKKASYDKNIFYKDSRLEKEIRSSLKSDVMRLLTSSNVVILDGLNYIKSFRYELYCSSKANGSTECTIYTIINKDDAWQYNENRSDDEKYTREIFDELLMRFEEPDGQKRWDIPLFHVLNDSELDLKAIEKCLFQKAPPPKNMSTQNPPLTDTNFLHDLNKKVREITLVLIRMVNAGQRRNVTLRDYNNVLIDLSCASNEKLIELSRQYINYCKINTPDIRQVSDLYLQYLNANLK